jgi:predicted metal-dependent peptidase
MSSILGGELTGEQRLQKGVVDILQNPKYVALAGVLLMGERMVVDIPFLPSGQPFTACTNGRDEAYGRAFIETLTDAELRFVLLHETYHKLYRHMTTWKHLYKEHAVLANMACDFVINVKISDDNADMFAVMPKGGCLDARYRGWDSAAVFNDLKHRFPPPPQGGKGGEGKGEEGDGSGEPSENKLSELGKGFDDHDWEGAEEMTEEEKIQLTRELDQAVRQGAMMAGKVGGDLDNDLKDMLKPKVDWRQVLREFISATCAGKDFSTYSKPNRRYIGAGYYMPSGISETVEEIVIAADLSGSCWGVLPQWLGEIHAVATLLKPQKLHLLWWDASVATPHEVYTTDDMEGIITSTHPSGGGGTDVRCVSKYLQEQGIKPQAVVVLTDGYLSGGWGEWTCPVLWCLVDHPGCSPSVGKRVHISTRG